MCGYEGTGDIKILINFKDAGATVVSHVDAKEWIQEHPHPELVVPDMTWGTGEVFETADFDFDGIEMKTIFGDGSAESESGGVFDKILGAGRRFVFSVFALENMLIGLLSSLLALVMAQAGAYWVCAVNFDIGSQAFPLASLYMVAATLVLVVSVGMIASRSILAQKPVGYLREQQNG